MDPDVETAIEGIETAFEVELNASQLGEEPTFERVYAALRSAPDTSTTHRCFASIVFLAASPRTNGDVRSAEGLDTPRYARCRPTV
jgi:hypothetical protein